MFSLSSKFIVRLDDASPYMDVDKWGYLEHQFDRLGITPIVAVIPFNEDPLLTKGKISNDFITILKRWSSKNWTLAMHGCYHKLNKSNRSDSLVSINDYSEFVGLSLEEQRARIKKGISFFKENKINIDTFIAPAHGFDELTLHALSLESEILYISDGISVWPYTKYGFKFIPQQLWRFKTTYFGFRTVCYHPEDFSLKELAQISDDLVKFRKHITTFEDAKSFKENYFFSLLNIPYKFLWYLKRQVIQFLRFVVK